MDKQAVAIRLLREGVRPGMDFVDWEARVLEFLCHLDRLDIQADPEVIAAHQPGPEGWVPQVMITLEKHDLVSGDIPEGWLGYK